MIRFVCLLFIFSGAFGFHSKTDEKHLQHGRYFVEEDTSSRKDELTERNAVLSDSNLWKDGVIIYQIYKKASNLLRTRILKVMKYIEDNTCIKFKERTNEEYYLNIQRTESHPATCSADVGFNTTEMNMSLGPLCAYFGVILHEMGHVIGLYDEHNRVDRDDYLTVDVYNALKDKRKYLEKRKPDNTRTIGPFDYNSIMMYSYYMYSRNPGLLKVFKPKKKTAELIAPRYKRKLSDWDVKKINILYKCDEKSRQQGSKNASP